MSEKNAIVETADGRWEVIGDPPSPELVEYFDSAMRAARETRQMAYAPYSQFQVGACALMDGKFYTGCNVENASYGATICAERNAIAAGIARGAKTIQLIVITTGAEVAVPIGNRSPCGICRQVIAEFSNKNTIVLLDSGRREQEFTGEAVAFAEMLPWQFALEG